MNFLAGKKLVNLVLVNVSRRLGLRRSLGRPFFMLIDPCNFCNLRCPLCISVLEKGNFGEGFMPIALYREALEYFGPYLTHLNLYNWGEPFLNKHIYEMIRLAKGYDIHVTISSNLNAGEPAEIVDSGLDVLICSLDGATQATYEKYRVKGNLERALARARQIVRLRKEKGVSKPLLIWQYLLFEHNKDELEMARGLAEQGGFDNFVSGPGHVWVEHPVIKPVSGELSRNEKGSLQGEKSKPANNRRGRRSFLVSRDDRCAWLHSAVAIDPAGGVFPCCILWKDAQRFASITDASLNGMFNSSRFKQARNYLTNVHRGRAPMCSFCASEKHTRDIHHCEVCNLFSDTYMFSIESVKEYFRARMRLPKIVERSLEIVMR